MHVHATAAGAPVVREDHGTVGIWIRFVEIGIGKDRGDGFSRVVVKNVVLADGVIRDLFSAEDDGVVAVEPLGLKGGSVEFFGLVYSFCSLRDLCCADPETRFLQLIQLFFHDYSVRTPATSVVGGALSPFKLLSLLPTKAS